VGASPCDIGRESHVALPSSNVNRKAAEGSTLRRPSLVVEKEQLVLNDRAADLSRPTDLAIRERPRGSGVVVEPIVGVIVAAIQSHLELHGSGCSLISWCNSYFRSAPAVLARVAMWTIATSEFSFVPSMLLLDPELL